MILSHVRGKKLKVQTHTCHGHGERHRLSIFWINRKQYLHLSTTEANINNDVFCTSKDSFVSIQNVLEF